MDNLGCGGGECSGNGDEFDYDCNDLMGVLNEDRENGGGLLGGVKGMEMAKFGQLGNLANGDFAGIDGGENGVLGLGFDYEGEEAYENCNGDDWVREDEDDGFMYEELRDMEAWFEQRELEREWERQGIENVLVEREQEWEQKLEEKEKKREEMEKDMEKLTRQTRMGSYGEEERREGKKK
ncbi:hypothetical protein POTOM_006016 [Populus tomentosa]|uniref:Uncharacterized protein n=1 Tax=Populus tomentosa TaxID=118781 RepID=A0A8X8AK86_POPTO|nr:hypothetical protein POTOM_006016 [Populus tomentosa]